VELKGYEPQSRLTVNTTIYPKGYAQSKCVSYIVTMRAGDG